MSCDIRISGDETFVWQVPEGNITIEAALQMCRETISLARSRKIYRFLCDFRGIRQTDSIINTYEFAFNQEKGPGFSQKDRVAVLHDPGDDSHNFMGTVCKNAGLKVKLFSNINEAIDWLKA